MTRADKLHIAGKTAIIAALLGGSSMSFAQEAAPVVVAPAQPAPIASPVAAEPAAQPTVAPPPAVRTLPGENDRVNAAAAEAAAAEAAEKREAASPVRAPVRPRALPRAVPVAGTAAAPSTEAIAPDADMLASPDVVAPTVDQIAPADGVNADIPPVAPINPATADVEGVTTEDMTLFGGLAAALAAIGIGAAFARRRRHKVVNDGVTHMATPLSDRPAPRPIKEDPVFQQFANSPAPERAIAAAPLIQRSKVISRPDVPITDPLFSREVVAAPITDPMFAPRNDVEPPITDPLFAKHDRFAGRAKPAETFATRTPELVN